MQKDIISTALNMGKVKLQCSCNHNPQLRQELSFVGDLSGLAQLVETLLLGLIQRYAALPDQRSGQPAYTPDSNQQLIAHIQAVIDASQLPAMMEGLEDIGNVVALAVDYVGLGWDASIALNQAITDSVQRPEPTRTMKRKKLYE